MFGIEEESKAHTWILDFGRRHQLSAMTVENGLCKVWVARYKSKVAKIEHITGRKMPEKKKKKKNGKTNAGQRKPENPLPSRKRQKGEQIGGCCREIQGEAGVFATKRQPGDRSGIGVDATDSK